MNWIKSYLHGGKVFVNKLSHVTFAQGPVECEPSWDKDWDHLDSENTVKEQVGCEEFENFNPLRKEKLCKSKESKYPRTIILVCNPILSVNSSGVERVTSKTENQLQHIMSSVKSIVTEKLKLQIGKIYVPPGDTYEHMFRAIKATFTPKFYLGVAVPCKAMPDVGFYPYSMHSQVATRFNMFRDSVKVEWAFRDLLHRNYEEAEKNYVNVAFAHPTTVAYFICRALQLPRECWSRFSLHSGSITTISIDRNGLVEVAGIGEIGFMPLKIKTI